MSNIGTAATGKVLQGNGNNAPVFSTATYPSNAGTALNLLQSDGTNWNSTAPLLLSASITLTNSQIKNLHGTSVQLIAAPGAGKAIIIHCCSSKLIYGGNNAFTAAAAQTIGFYYNSSTTTNNMTAVSNAMLTSTANKFSLVNTALGATTVNVAAGVMDNVNIALWNSVATEISGNAANDNTIDIVVLYSIMSF